MSDLVSSRVAPLFNQALVASLIQPIGQNQQDYKSYRTKVILKINEQRNETTSEKELKFELSRSDDFEFLYAETLNNERYQRLAKEHDLIVDFDAFPRTIIQKLLCKNIANSDEDEKKGNKDGPLSIADNRPTDITLTLDAERTTCSFELFSKTPISRGRIFSLKLPAVRGEQLTSHLLRICTSLSTKLAEYKKTGVEVKSYQEKVSQLKKENEELRQKTEKNRVELDKIEELTEELELLKDEKQNALELADEKQDAIEELENKIEELKITNEEIDEELRVVAAMIKEEQERSDRLQKEKDDLRQTVSTLRREKDTLSRNLEKSGASRKENDQMIMQQSVDLQKIKELQTDLKEKESLIARLNETVSDQRKQIEDDQKKLTEMASDVERFRNEKITADRLLRLSSSRPSPMQQNFGAQNQNVPHRPLMYPAANTLNGSPYNTTGSPYYPTTPNTQGSPYNTTGTSPFYSTTPSALRNNLTFANDTTTSTVPNNTTYPNNI